MPLEFRTFDKNLKNLDVSIPIKRAVELTKEDAIDLNRDQLAEGKQSTGKPLRTYASDWYSRFKQTKNSVPPYGTPDLELKGGFKKGMYGDVSQIENGVLIKVNSTDFKTQWLIEGTKRMRAFGKNVWGLTNANLGKYVTGRIVGIFAKEIKKDIFKNNG